MREFEFKQTYEEFKLGGKVYKVDFSDKALKRYQADLWQYKKQEDELSKIDIENLNEEEQKEAYEKALEALQTFIDCILGKGSFKELYAASGESSDNMADLVYFLGEIIGERLQGIKEKTKKQKYTKKKGK